MKLREHVESAQQDIQYAARGLRREPLFAAFIVVTLALGIGANAAMFGVVDRLLLRGPNHVREPHQLVRFYMKAMTPWAGERTFASMGYPAYRHLRNGARLFDGVAAYSTGPALVGRGRDARPLNVASVTADFFSVVGVAPALGRFISADEDRPSAPRRVAVISHGMWRADFGSSRDVLGKQVVIGNDAYTIVGVAPAAFTGVELGRVDAWTPMSVRGAAISREFEHGWGAQFLQVIGRRKAGVSIAQASDDATATHRGTYDGQDKWMAGASVLVAPTAYGVTAQEMPEAGVSRWLIGVSAAVLLVACANVTNLLLARAVRRRREIAVRLALGAGRARLIRLLLAEGALLALAGGVASLVVAYLLGDFVRRTLLPNVEWTAPPIDARVLGVCAIVAALTGLVVGLIPAIRASGLSLANALKTGARGGGERSRMRAALMLSQTALSVVLLIGAGVFVRSIWRVQAIDLGVQPDRVLTTSVRSLSAGAGLRAVEALRTAPGIESASLAVGLPFSSSFGIGVHVRGLDSIPALPGGGPYVSAVTSDYFTTTGTRIVRGRAFGATEGEGAERVAIVSETMAGALWPGRDAIGECLMIGDVQPAPCSRVVGVAADVHRTGFREPAYLYYYVPYGQEARLTGGTLLVRPRGDAVAAIPSVIRTIQQVDPGAGYLDVKLMSARLDGTVRPWRLGAAMFLLCGLLALVVAAIGIYSVLSYLVAQRAHEMGVRIALGARTSAIVWLVVRGGAGVAAAGVLAGWGLAYFAARRLRPLLFEAPAFEPAVFAFTAGVIGAVALLACIVPAWRAAQASPLTALRND